MNQMFETPVNRLAVFIDNSSLFQAFSKLGIPGRFDYVRLKDWLIKQRPVECLRFYCGEVRQDRKRRKQFYDVLERAGFEVTRVFEPRSRESNAAFDKNNCRKLHCEIAYDMCESFHNGVNHVILVSGCSELARTVQKVQKKGVDVEVAFFHEFCAPALRLVANNFRDLKVKGLVRSSSKSGVGICCESITTESV